MKRGTGRKFIAPGSATELRVLFELVHQRESGAWPLATDSEEWKRIVGLLKRSLAMHAIGDAFTELVDDEKTLYDPEQHGRHGAAVSVSLDRDNLGQISITVSLSEIDGGQLAYVLEVARRHELEVREERGWLRLSPQLIVTDDEMADALEEARA